MEDIIIYVAGNPAAYPIEYYNSGSGTYEGMIPRLLQDFSEKTVYDIRYYAPGEEDRRSELASNLQVDLISGCDGTEDFRHVDGGDVILLQTETEGERIQYRIYLTEVATERFAADFREYMSGVSQEVKTALLIDNTYDEIKAQNQGMHYAVLALSVTTALLAGALAVLIHKYRARLKKEREDLERDKFTGIGNIDYMLRKYRAFVNDQNRVLYRMYYFYIDTDHMERTNGREKTDEFLLHTAAVLLDCIADGDILARVSDGGFAVLRNSDSGIEAMEEWLLSALGRIRDFTDSENENWVRSTAAGVYNLAQDDRDLNEILFGAAQCARAACHSGENYGVCTNELLAALAEEKRLQADVRRGFEEGEFQLYVQFYVNAVDKKVIGGEALARWEHPGRGFLTSGAFIPLMEKEGLIDKLDFYLLEKACKFLDRLKRAGISDFFISCNFSRDTFSREDFAEKCSEIVDQYCFDRSRLVFEITESAMFRDVSVARKNIFAIKSMGICIALDDFGDGFTSFFDIQETSLDVLKLDKTLVDNVGTAAGDAIVRSVIHIGHELGIAVFAEGIESDSQAERLCELECDVFQGFRYYYPLPDNEAEKLLRKLFSE